MYRHKLRVETVKDGIIYPLSPNENGCKDFNAYGGVFDKDFNFIDLSKQLRYDYYTNAVSSWNIAPPRGLY